MSRAVTSLRQVTPATPFLHSSSEARRSRWPITTASSASWCTSRETDCGGRMMGCPCPIRALVGFIRSSGSFGTSLASSLAWST